MNHQRNDSYDVFKFSTFSLYLDHLPVVLVKIAKKKSIISKFIVTFSFPSFLFPNMLGGSGISKSKTSTIEVTAETEKEVMTLDDQETFGNFFKSASHSTLQDSVVVTEEDLSQIQADTPKLVYKKPFYA